MGKLCSLPTRLLRGRAVALSGYFTFQNPQRHVWFWNDSTPLKRGEPYQCTEDLEKGINHISLSLARDRETIGSICETLWLSAHQDLAFLLSPVVTAVPSQPSLQFLGRVLAIDLLLDFCSAPGSSLTRAFPSLSGVPQHAGHLLQHAACSKALSSGSFKHTSQDLSATINYRSSISSN